MSGPGGPFPNSLILTPAERAAQSNKKMANGTGGGRWKIATPVVPQEAPGARGRSAILATEEPLQLVCNDPITWWAWTTEYTRAFSWASGSSTRTQSFSSVDSGVILMRFFVALRAPIGESAALGTGASYALSGLGLTWGAARGSATVDTATHRVLTFFIDGVGTPTAGTITVTKSGAAPTTDWDYVGSPATFKNGLVLPIDPATGSGQTVTGAGSVTATLTLADGDNPCDGVYYYYATHTDSSPASGDPFTFSAQQADTGIVTSPGKFTAGWCWRRGTDVPTLVVPAGGQAQIAGIYELRGHAGVP